MSTVAQVQAQARGSGRRCAGEILTTSGVFGRANVLLSTGSKTGM
jgi:hypothetical protein